MSTIDFKKFDLDGLSLESMEDKNDKEPKVDKVPETANNIDSKISVETESEQVVALTVEASQAENTEEQMTCPKCEQQQIKADQCSSCGVYVKKALAQIDQSKIKITATKF